MKNSGCICEYFNKSHYHFNSGNELEYTEYKRKNILCSHCGKMLTSYLNRRHFLKLAMMGAAAVYLSSCAKSQGNLLSDDSHAQLTFMDYKIFFDRQDQGHSASSSSVVYNDGNYMLLFQKASDTEPGISPQITHTTTPGLGWSEPEQFGPDIIEDPENEFLGLRLFGPTSQGTILPIGVHVDWFKEDVNLPRWRPGTLIIGRNGPNDTRFTYDYYESGVFLGEQFVLQGISLKTGRILLPIWGAMHKGDNWQCGILLSDDDGKSWGYCTVGYEPDKSIRNNPDIPAGYNEQTLFETKDGKVISLIRGRAKLGQVPESPRDTWFFRSVSEDGGENWSEPEVTNIAGTGASSNGVTLPDGSLLHACRIPYSRNLYNLPQENLYGLHVARSFDLGKTWETAWMVQQDPEGTPFDNYYNAMNGRFIQINGREWFYVFGQFDVKRDIHRILMMRIQADRK